MDSTRPTEHSGRVEFCRAPETIRARTVRKLRQHAWMKKLDERRLAEYEAAGNTRKVGQHRTSIAFTERRERELREDLRRLALAAPVAVPRIMAPVVATSVPAADRRFADAPARAARAAAATPT